MVSPSKRKSEERNSILAMFSVLDIVAQAKQDAISMGNAGNVRMKRNANDFVQSISIKRKSIFV